MRHHNEEVDAKVSEMFKAARLANPGCFDIDTKTPLPETKGIASTMRKLLVGDSFVVPITSEHTRKGLYATAKRVGVPITTQVEGEGIRVWRNFEKKTDPVINFVVSHPVENDEEPMTKEEKLENLRALMSGEVKLITPEGKPIEIAALGTDQDVCYVPVPDSA